MSDSAKPMDVDDPKINVQDKVKKTLKRKRGSSLVESLTPDQKEAQIKSLNEELEGLLRYYEEMREQKPDFGLDSGLGECSSINSMVTVLMEESGLPLSKLVDVVFEKVKEKLGNVTIAAVKTALLFVGQRVMYGVPNADADVLEDDTESCLWCWETRDLKLMPKSVSGALKIRRTCRKKIHERITAVSSLIAALKRCESDQAYNNEIVQASDKLGKVLTEGDIRLLVDNMMQKNGTCMAEKEANREEKMLIKQLKRNKQEAEKEKKRLDREIQKEKLESEKEQKRLQEAAKEEKRREKEQSEMKRQLKKQQEEAEKDQRRREKEESELKKQLALQKQASVMEKFLKRSKTSPLSQTDQFLSKVNALDLSSKKVEILSEAITESMDCALSSNSELNIDGLRRSHMASWRHLGHAVRSNPKQLWGIRKKPKTELFKELKLADRWGEKSNDRSNSSVSDVKMFNRRKKLLQFDKSHRPAFYGFWPTKSQVVGPRNPTRKDPDLDYEVDSDEEWEEEEPGESLSDCDKAEEEESLEEGCSKADDEDESEDGFFVPDGYLSENEGVQVDRRGTGHSGEEAKSSPSSKQYLESDEFCALLRQQKNLHNVTEHALRKNQPLIVLNLMHEKAPPLVSEDLTGTAKLEQMCLQALCVCVFSGLPAVEISIENIRDEDQEACLSSGKDSTTPVSVVRTIPDADLPTVVSAIQSCSQGINKVVESLQTKFPDVSKAQIKNKVREISVFADNRWQVKKEILVKLGLSVSPASKSGGRTKSIAAFFTKRCLPNPIETSPQPPVKSSGSSTQGQCDTSNNV